ncbi:Protein of unknown function (DUF2993) [Murinocardiopsis flavida]|uniref:DUF2993 family protein n=1 Tax=Murinocardiopsis flavida TaxID=645275 RepID=A0A2P8DQX3_9ACTN|nr:DUF2993 domain-containing protein [Murinocardiopsis flavida]PSK99610.1 Protein of unknown function (DUF2993) [Murinocardiopsis flavida]
MRKFIVFLILLLLVVVAADRLLLYAAQSEVAKQVDAQYQTASEPEVVIGGFPFLTQAFSGEYSEIQVVTGALTVQDIQLERIDATARGVKAPLGDLLTEPKATASTLDAKVMLPYSELQKRMPEGIVIETENGTPRISGDLAVLGYSVPIEGELKVSVDGDTVTVTPGKLKVDGGQIGAEQAQERLKFSFPLGELPFDLQVKDIEALPNGVQLSGTAKDVPLIGAGPQG